MKRTVLVFLFAMLVAVFGFQVRSADAYSTVTTCAGCHTFGNSSSQFHQGHLNLGLPNSCQTCHVQTGDTPATARCGGCHVAPGLPLHHVNANAGVNCVSCPPGTPAPENAAVPGYAGLTVALDPCDGSEERFNSLTISLDNDGDLLYDGADPDCAAAAPDIAVTDSVPPANDNQVLFGNVTVGASSDQTVTVTNAGTANLVIGTVASANPLAAPFSIPGGTDTCSGQTLAPSASCTITVRFSPTATGAANDTFNIPSNDPDENPVTISVAGTGISPTPVPDIAVNDSVAPPADLQIPFGNVTVGTSSDQTVTVSNAGNDNLVIGTIAQVNPLATPFTILNDTCSGQTLAPAASCTLTARFSPNATSSSSDSFDIPSNDPDENPVTVNVSGTGTGASVSDINVTDSVAPTNDLQVPFGSVTVGASSDQTVTVNNAGASNLVIGTVASGNPLAAPFSIPSGTDNCSGMTLAPAASCSITVRFAPTATGAANDTFDIPSNDPDENPVTVTVNGTGVANNPPAAPALVTPADGATGLPTTVTFEWNRSADPDADPVTYNLFICTDNTFAACPDPVNTTPITTAAVTKKGLAFAASGLGMMFFGIAFAAGISRRRKVALLLALALTTGMLFIACSNDETSTPRGQVSFAASGLSTGTSYFWKVVATDGTGSIDSVTRGFTTK